MKYFIASKFCREIHGGKGKQFEWLLSGAKDKCWIEHGLLLSCSDEHSSAQVEKNSMNFWCMTNKALIASRFTIYQPKLGVVLLGSSWWWKVVLRNLFSVPDTPRDSNYRAMVVAHVHHYQGKNIYERLTISVQFSHNKNFIVAQTTQALNNPSGNIVSPGLPKGTL